MASSSSSTSFSSSLSPSSSSSLSSSSLSPFRETNRPHRNVENQQNHQLRRRKNSIIGKTTLEREFNRQTYTSFSRSSSDDDEEDGDGASTRPPTRAATVDEKTKDHWRALEQSPDDDFSSSLSNAFGFDDNIFVSVDWYWWFSVVGNLLYYLFFLFVLRFLFLNLSKSFFRARDQDED